jgi:hypothetical protein
MDVVEEDLPLPDGVSWESVIKSRKSTGCRRKRSPPVIADAGLFEPTGGQSGFMPGGPGLLLLLSVVPLVPYQVEEFFVVVIGQSHDQGADPENGR